MSNYIIVATTVFWTEIFARSYPDEMSLEQVLDDNRFGETVPAGPYDADIEPVEWVKVTHGKNYIRGLGKNRGIVEIYTNPDPEIFEDMVTAYNEHDTEALQFLYDEVFLPSRS